MVQASPPGYSYVEVVRKIYGGKDFTSHAAIICAETLSGIPDTAVANTFFAGSLMTQHLVTYDSPLYEVNRDKDLVVLLEHRGVKAERANWYRIAETKAHLSTDRYKVPKHALDSVQGQRYLPSLRQSLDAAAQEVITQAGAEGTQSAAFGRISFDKVGLLGTPGTDRIIGIHPNPEDVGAQIVAAQVQVARERLRMENQRLVEASKQQWFGAAVVARIAERVSEARVQLVIDRLQELLPLHLELGSIYVRDDGLV